MVEDFPTNTFKMLQKQVRNRYEAHKEVEDLQKKLGGRPMGQARDFYMRNRHEIGTKNSQAARKIMMQSIQEH